MVKFQTLALVFDVTWRDIQFLLVNCYTPTEREKILTADPREANEALTRNPGDVTVPVIEPHWDYAKEGSHVGGHPSWNENRSHKACEL
jgi:hypothetical protein